MSVTWSEPSDRYYLDEGLERRMDSVLSLINGRERELLLPRFVFGRGDIPVQYDSCRLGLHGLPSCEYRRVASWRHSAWLPQNSRGMGHWPSRPYRELLKDVEFLIRGEIRLREVGFGNSAFSALQLGKGREVCRGVFAGFEVLFAVDTALHQPCREDGSCVLVDGVINLDLCPEESQAAHRHCGRSQPFL
jgi:hypothetical protein